MKQADLYVFHTQTHLKLNKTLASFNLIDPFDIVNLYGSVMTTVRDM